MGNAGSANNFQNDGIQSELNLCYTQEYLRRTTGETKKKNLSVLGGWSSGRRTVDCTVLPKPTENVKLRPTTNGAILQAGGTISFRAKEQAEQSKPTTFLPMRRCHTLILDGQNEPKGQRKSAAAQAEFRRSQTLILVGYNKRKVQDNNITLKTCDYPAQSHMQNISSSSTLKVNKYNKKRKAPPAPTQLSAKEDDSSRVHNQILNDQKTTTLAKPRIYTTNISKAPTTQKQYQSPTMKVNRFQRDSNARKSVNSASHMQFTSSAYASKFPYRREKSFDAKLLRQQTPNDGSDKSTLRNNGPELFPHETKGKKNLWSRPDNGTNKKGLNIYNKTHNCERDYNKDKPKLEERLAPEKNTKLSLSKGARKEICNDYTNATNECKTKYPQSRIPQLKRTFYFGMDVVSKSPNLSTTLQTLSTPVKNKPTQEENKDMPELHHKIDAEEEIVDNGILVHIRPTLPRRQLETPSFSPVAAWRNLLEEKQCLQLERCKFRQIAAEHRLAETPICLKTGAKENYTSTNADWTPQQDLKDEDERTENEVNKPENYLHTFSLSLPRDVHLQYQANSAKEPKDQENSSQTNNCLLVPGFNSLQKFKTTDFHSHTKCTCSSKTSFKRNCFHVENMFGDSFVTDGKCMHQPDCELNRKTQHSARYQTDNWLLDKSKDNLLDNTCEILEDSFLKTSANSLSLMNFQPKSLSNICSGKHIVYLPGQNSSITANKDSYKNSKQNKTTLKPNYKKQRQRQEDVRESLQDLTPIQNIHQGNGNITEKNTHRFSFQSTVRVLEKRRLAEKLSKDAEVQEAQRLHELEAIKRVEEDFQRKRAPEKANLRNQLRLHFKANAEYTEYRSLPLNINEKIHSKHANQQQISDANNNIFCRAEPDGAVSPSVELKDDLPKIRQSSVLLSSTKPPKDLDCFEYDVEESENEAQLCNLQCSALLIEPYLNSII